MGSNHLIGDIYSLEPILQEDRSYRIWLVNRFGERVAFLDASEEARVLSLQARGWTLRALLSFVAMSQGAKGYWGEVVLLCNDPHYDTQFNTFAENLRNLMAKGIRPAIDFTNQAAKQIVESGGSWLPTDRTTFPCLDKESALVKTHRNLSDSLVEAGRRKNKGCYAITWILWLALGAVVVAGVVKLFGLL